MTAHALLAAAAAALLIGPYPLVKWSELVLSARWEEPVRFLPLLQDAAGRGVLQYSVLRPSVLDGGGASYAFVDDELRARLAADGRAALAELGRRQAGLLAGRGTRARLARRLGDKRIARPSVDAGLGVLAAVAATLLVAARPSVSPSTRWVAFPVSILVGALAGAAGGGLVYLALSFVARAATVSLAYLPLTTRRGRLRATGVAVAAAVALVALAGPVLAGVAAYLLPAALVAACGGWATALARQRTRARDRPRWQRAAPDLTAAATIGCTLYLLVHHRLLTATPAAGLPFPVAAWGAFRVWQVMNAAGRTLVRAAADLAFALLLGGELVLVLVWLANVLDMPLSEVAGVRAALDRAGALADLPWWAWTAAWLLLAAASLAFIRWPVRLKQAAKRFERWRLVTVTEVTERALTGVHVGLLALVFVGLAGPPALTPLLSRQLRDDYAVAFERELTARAELAAYTAIARPLAFQPRSPILILLITKIHDVSPPDDRRQASATETANARRLGESQALALALADPPPLDALVAAADTAAGEGGSAAAPSGLDGRAAAVQKEEAAADTAAKRVEAAADVAAKVVASLVAIPQLGDNEVVQVVREYLAGLIEDSPLKDTFAAWIERLPGAHPPPEPAAEVVPVPLRLEEAATVELSAAFTAAGANDPVTDPLADPALFAARAEDPLDGAVDIVNQARYAQQRTGPCSGCTEPGVNDDKTREEKPPEEHFFER